MKKSILILLSFIPVIFFTAAVVREKPVAVLAGTSIIEALVKDYSPDIEVSTLVPAGECPGHFDMSPYDAKKVKNADLLLIHPFQAGLGKKIKETNGKITVRIINTPDLNIPDNYISALSETAQVLDKFFPGRAKKAGEARLKEIQDLKFKEAKADRVFREVKEKKYRVLASMFEKNFAEYCGFEVVGVFSDPDSLSLKQAKELIKKGKEKKIDFIISNLTGNHGATADMLNKELKSKIITFSNFPLVEDEEGAFLTLWEYNLEQLEKVLPESK